MKILKIIAVVSICVAASIAIGKDEIDGIVKVVKTAELDQLKILRAEARKYASWGCITLAKEKQKEFISKMEKIRTVGLKKLDKDYARQKKDVNEDTIMCFFRDVTVPVVRLEVFVNQHVKNINVLISNEKAVSQSIQNMLLKKGVDKTKFVKNIWHNLGFKVNESTTKSLVFYLSNNLENDSPKMILAYVIKELLLKNNIKVNILCSFDSRKIDIIELNVDNNPKKIEWDKSLDFLDNLQKVMINFADIKKAPVFQQTPECN